jgi:hypothetical protein
MVDRDEQIDLVPHSFAGPDHEGRRRQRPMHALCSLVLGGSPQSMINSDGRRHVDPPDAGPAARRRSFENSRRSLVSHVKSIFAAMGMRRPLPNAR